MSRRTAERHSHRVEVRFWRQGESQSHSGFTVDLSKTGMFLSTTLSLEPGERLRLEVVDRERGFQVEGQVARVHRVAMALRHIEQPGAGIRFLGPAELVGNLLHRGKKGRGAEAKGAQSGFFQSLPKPSPASSPQPDPPEASAPPPKPAPARATAPPPGESLEDLFGPDPEAEAKVAAAPAPVAEKPTGAAPPPAPRSTAPLIPVEFADREGFLSVYGRDIEAGGLFVTTDTPASLHEVVMIDLRPPIRADKKFCFEARVVHRFDPQSGGAGSQPGLTGMGVQFLDPDRVRSELAPVVAELNG